VPGAAPVDENVVKPQVRKPLPERNRSSKPPAPSAPAQ
jgi:hypothetical protein